MPIYAFLKGNIEINREIGTISEHATRKSAGPSIINTVRTYILIARKYGTLYAR
jgi:hypothetical protein